MKHRRTPAKKNLRMDSDFCSAGLTPRFPLVISIPFLGAWLGYLVYFYYESIWLPYGRETYAVVELALKFLEIMKRGLAWRLVMLASFLFGAVQIGRAVLAVLGLREGDFVEESLFAAGLGAGALSLVMLALGLAHLWNTALLRALFLLLPALSLVAAYLEYRGKIRSDATIPAPKPPSATASLGPLEWSAIILLAIAAASALLSTAAPEDFYDALVYHLALPKLYLLNQGIVPTVYNAFSGAPQGVQMLYGLLLAIGDEHLTALLHFSFGLGTAFVLWRCACKQSSRAVGIMSALLFFLCPIALYASSVSGADLAASFYCALAFFALLRSIEPPDVSTQSGANTKNRAWSICTGLFIGLGMSMKYNVFSVGAVLLLVHAWATRRRGLPLMNAVFASLAAFLVLSPWLLKNLSFFGNPLYPFLSNLRGSGPHPADWSGFLGAAHARNLAETFTTAAGWKEFLLTPWTLSTGSEGLDNWPGLALIAVLPWMIFLRWKNDSYKFSAIAAAGAYLAWSLPSRQGRFFLPALPIIAYASALSVNQSDVPQWARRLGWVGLLLLCLANFQAYCHQNFQSGRWAFLESGADKELRLKDAHVGYPTPPYMALMYINRALPLNAKVLFVGEDRGFYCERNFVAPSFYDENPLWLAVGQSTSAQQIQERLAAAGITHILLNGQGLLRGSLQAVLPPKEVRSAASREFFSRYLRTVYEDRDETSGNPRWLFVYELLSRPKERADVRMLNVPQIVLDQRLAQGK